MTSTHDGWDAELTARAADSSECLLVIGAYTQNQGQLDKVVAAARDQILMSPALGDFFELRLVDMGPRPGTPDDDAAGVARLVFELTSRPRTAARNFSALLFIDQSAVEVERVLRDFGANSVLSELNVRFRGIARKDDRSPVTEGGVQETGPRTVMSPEGERLTTDDLEVEVARYAEDLLVEFGTGGEQGLSARRLDELGAEAESRLHSVVEADMAATLERRKAELMNEAARREAALRQEIEQRQEAERRETERRELKRDAERRAAEAVADPEAEAAAERETGLAPAEQGDPAPQQAGEATQPRLTGPLGGLVSRARNRSSSPDADGADLDANAMLLDCKARIAAGDEKTLRAYLAKLRAHADAGISDAERRSFRVSIIEDRLLWPGRDLGDLDVQFYNVLLRLAYGLPLSYAAYCDVEDFLSAVGGRPSYPQPSLLEAISEGGTADIRVAAVARYHLGEDRLTKWFRSGQVEVKQLFDALDGTWDRPHHADIMYNVTLDYLSGRRWRYNSRTVMAGLRAHGYLAAALLRQYPELEQHQISLMIAFLRAAYPDKLDRRTVKDIVAVSDPTRALRRAVLASLRVPADREWAADVFADQSKRKALPPGKKRPS
jgi:hypothetical protein